MASCKPGKTPAKETISRGYCATTSGCYKEVATSFIQNLRTFSLDGSNSLYVDDPALDPEATLIEVPPASSLDKNPKPATGLQASIICCYSCPTLAISKCFCFDHSWMGYPPAAMSFAMIAADAAKSEAAPPTPTINIHLKRDSSTLLESKSNKLHTFSSFQESLHASKKSSAANLKEKVASGASALAVAQKVAARASALAVARDLKQNYIISSRRGLSVVAMATSSQRRSKHDMERVMQLGMFMKQWEFHGWNVYNRLIQIWFTGNISMHCRISFWKIDYMKTFTRMHRFLRRDFKSSNHSGIFAVSEDPLNLERDKQNSVLALEALSSSLVNEDDDQDAFVNADFNIDEMWLHEDI
nr:hypothetical protein [Tanacetum cinerariifolium]